MRKYFYKIILGCIFLFVTNVLVVVANESDTSSGGHTARIIVPRAIVYSDENMNSPLGYISNDKFIKVGNPRKKNPDLVPVVISGRLAFIESKNLHFENESIENLNSKRGAPKEHNIDIVLTKPEEKLSENNSAYFALHQFAGGIDTKTLFENVDGANKQNYLSLGAYLYHRSPANKFFWGAGYEFNSITSNNIQFKIYMLNPTIGYTPIKTSLFLIDLSFSLDFSLGTEFKITNNTDEEPSPFLWGPQLTSRIVFTPNQKYHFYGGIGYRTYNVLNLNSVFDSSENLVNGISKISGIDLSIGFALEI